jgi:hypothetical protein
MTTRAPLSLIRFRTSGVRQPLKGPITPDRYIEEMQAIGWEPYTIVQTLPSGKTVAMGTYENASSNYFPTDEQ